MAPASAEQIAAFLRWARDERGLRLADFFENPLAPEAVHELVAEYTGATPGDVEPHYPET